MKNLKAFAIGMLITLAMAATTPAMASVYEDSGKPGYGPGIDESAFVIDSLPLWR